MYLSTCLGMGVWYAYSSQVGLQRVILLTLILGLTVLEFQGPLPVHHHRILVSGVEFLRALGNQSGVSVWQHTLVG